MTRRAFIIAEAGVNHDGSLAVAKELIDVAAEAGADAVKFQTFRANDLVARQAPQAEYQRRNLQRTESQADMIRRLELLPDEFRELAAHGIRRGIRFLSTPFDQLSLAFLVDELAMDRIKLSSGDITNGPLLLSAARTGLPVILSTGMSVPADIEAALAVLAWGYSFTDGNPGLAALHETYKSAEGQAMVSAKVTLLQCTSEYPAPPIDVNLRVMATLARDFGVATGLSDHTAGVAIAVAAAAMGANVIEKHFTLDRKRPGPDHRASLEPDELRRLVAEIRQVEDALGTPIKQIMPSEGMNQAIGRRSLVALCPIAVGEVFTEENLGTKRPGTGISPMHYWDYLGRAATRAYSLDEAIEP